jgi:predicted metal-binding membrane protein
VSARAILWPVFFGGVLAAWAALWAMGQQARALSVYGAEFWAALCGAGEVGFGPLAGMWALMAAAMMVPTMVPALRTFLDLPAPAGGAGQAMALSAGYLSVWLGASLGFAGLQLGLARAGLVAPDGRSLSLLLTSGLFVIAGAYQFSRFKSACLSRCRAPLTLFLSHWRPGVRPALTMGLRMGADCLGCCWALMALAFVGGMANLLWMGLATALMVLEKLPEIGRPLTRPLGWVLLVAGVGSALGGLT